jgi:Cu/Ag efflux protein CusF
MKTLTSFVAVLAAVAIFAGASFAQAPATPAAPAPSAPKAAAPAAGPTTPAPAAQAPAKAPVVQNITGEFVAMDKAAKTVTVKHVVDNKPTQITLGVDDTMLTALAQIKAGDKVKVTYEEMGGKFVAKTIVKA